MCWLNNNMENVLLLVDYIWLVVTSLTKGHSLQSCMHYAKCAALKLCESAVKFNQPTIDIDPMLLPANSRCMHVAEVDSTVSK